ncbi:MAG: DnaA/Hda family protein [Deltaproteobacteria bacterium]|nr:DnaA/Hda family protein [Deltaproteobacteria bacterium]
MTQLEKQWNLCKALLGRKIGPDDSSAWLESLRLEEIQPRRVVLSGAPNTFLRNRILRRFRKVLLETLAESFPDIHLEESPQLEITIGGNASVEDGPAEGAGLRVGGTQTDSGSESEFTEYPSDDAGVIPKSDRHRMDNFLVSPNNEATFKLLLAVLEQPGKLYNPLYIAGAPGLGKTHLLKGLAHGLGILQPDWNVLYTTGETFKNEVLDSITRRRSGALRNRYRNCRVLLLDNLEHLLVSPRTQEELLHTMDHLHSAGRQMVFSSCRLPLEMESLLENLRSRMDMGLIVSLGPPDYQTRRRFLAERAAREGLELPEEVFDTLAARISKDMRRLEGALVRIGAYGALEGGAVGRMDTGFALELAAPFFDTDPARAASADKVLELVARRHGLGARALRGKGRTPNVVSARRLAIHLLRICCAMSYPEIGALLGNRSHSTIIHGHRTLLAELERNPGLQALLRQLEQSLDSAG